MIKPVRSAPITIADTLRCYCINKDPVVILTYGMPMAGAAMLSPYLANRRAYFLVGTWWTFLDKNILDTVTTAYGLMKDVFPEHEYIFLANDLAECKALDHLKLPNFFCHHNAFIDERIFRPLQRVQKTLDAVYTARLVKIKRHRLAKDIPVWGLLYGYDITEYEKQMSYLNRLSQMMPGMVLLNGDPGPDQYKYLTPHQVCEAYNKAHVGLCLSAIEGGNYATTEYMLSGLPVVSTRSLGGREFFLDPSTSRIVDDDPAAIAQAVCELIDQRIPPHFVRLQALKKMQEMRNDFIRLVNVIIEEEGKQPDFAERFNAIFTNKMFTYSQSPADFLSQNELIL